MLKPRRSILNQAGDTIVEVMIVVAVLGLTFALAYATANRSLAKARNSEEHSEALQYLNSQVELLRNDASDSNLYSSPGTPFCMDQTTDLPVPTTSAACTVGIEGIFKVSVVYQNISYASLPQDVFTFTVAWPGVGDLGQQQEHISYKLHQL